MMEMDTSELLQMPASRCAVDFLHRFAEHVAKGNTLDETLAGAIEFAVGLVRCDECVAYVRDGAELIPWVWKYSIAGSPEQSRLPIDQGYAAVLAKHQEPIAISQGTGTASEVKYFSTWSTNPGETCVSIPLVVRQRLLGAINLEHFQPRPYSRRELNLLVSMARLLAADIRISQLESENSDLVLELETRKLVERSKGILQRDLGLTVEEAYLALERQSRQKQRPMKEIAQAIILSDEVRRSSLAN